MWSSKVESDVESLKDSKKSMDDYLWSGNLLGPSIFIIVFIICEAIWVPIRVWTSGVTVPKVVILIASLVFAVPLCGAFVLCILVALRRSPFPLVMLFAALILCQCSLLCAVVAVDASIPTLSPWVLHPAIPISVLLHLLISLAALPPAPLFLVPFSISSVAAWLLAAVVVVPVRAPRFAWLVTTSLLPLAGGAVSVCYCAVRLESHRRAHERARMRMVQADRIRAEGEQRSMFLANMSHELRTPLNSIIMSTELMQDTKLNAVQRRCCKNIASSGAALLALVNDVLDFAKLEAGQVRLTPEPMALKDLLEETLDMVYPMALAKGLETFYRFGPGVPERVVADRQRLQQVLVNLSNNAVKFCDTGSVHLLVEVEEGEVAPPPPQTPGVSAWIRRKLSGLPEDPRSNSHPSLPNTSTTGLINAPSASASSSSAMQPTTPVASMDVERKRWLRFTVVDTGIGIPEDQLEAVFERFRQVDEGPTRRIQQGSGLGLAICKELVRLMQGRIGVESEVGRGSKFWFTLPLVEDRQETGLRASDPLFMGSSSSSSFVVLDSISQQPIAKRSFFRVLVLYLHELLVAQLSFFVNSERHLHLQSLPFPVKRDDVNAMFNKVMVAPHLIILEGGCEPEAALETIRSMRHQWPHARIALATWSTDSLATMGARRFYAVLHKPIQMRAFRQLLRDVIQDLGLEDIQGSMMADEARFDPDDEWTIGSMMLTLDGGECYAEPMWGTQGILERIPSQLAPPTEAVNAGLFNPDGSSTNNNSGSSGSGSTPGASSRTPDQDTSRPYDPQRENSRKGEAVGFLELLDGSGDTSRQGSGSGSNTPSEASSGSIPFITSQQPSTLSLPTRLPSVLSLNNNNNVPLVPSTSQASSGSPPASNVLGGSSSSSDNSMIVMNTNINTATNVTTVATSGNVNVSSSLPPSISVSSSYSSSAVSVLLVEDVDINRALAARLLNQMKYEGREVRVTEARDGAEAVRLCRDDKFDVVLMDCFMPQVDGWQATEQLRAEKGESSNAPVVALTADATGREKCMTAGMDDVVEKPVTKAKLQAILSKWVGKQHK